MSQPSYPGSLPPAAVASRLREATRTSYHDFWPDSHSLLDPAIVDWRLVDGPKQITDTYLVSLAVRHGGCFATFDTRINARMVSGAEETHLRVVRG